MPVRPITIAESFDAALPLMRENWRETGDAYAFEPSREFYVQAEASGWLFAMGAFVGDELVGYVVITVAPHPFNPAVRMACGNPLYVTPAHRCGLLSGLLVIAAEREAARRGACKVHWVVRAGTRAAEIFPAHGYVLTDTVFEKELAPWA